MKNRYFGILIDSYDLKEWQVSAIKKIIAFTNYKLKLIIINNKEKNSSQYRLNNILFYAYKYLFVRTFQLKAHSISSFIKSASLIKCNPIEKGRYSNYFSKADIDKVKQYDLDFLLRFGFGILRGEILKTPKYGIWSFHHGDEQKYRGGPYCFWEIYKNDPVTGAIFQRLTNKLDGGIVLRKGYFKTQKHSFNRSIEQSLRESSIWPMQVCKDIENGIDDYIFDDPVKTNAPVYKLPDNFTSIKFVFKISWNKVKYLGKYLKTDVWGVGVIDKPLDEINLRNLDSEEVSWVNQNNNKYFLADPFPALINGKIIVFAEKYEYLKAKGDIIAINIKTRKEFLSFSSKYHYSYPNTFINEEQVYQINESYEQNQISLHRLKEFPDGWDKMKVLVNCFKGVDSSVLYYNNKWWLFTTEKGNGHSYKLFIFYSNSLTDGKWMHHENNPVKMNIRSGRGAGSIFRINEDYFRPAQNYSKSHEGSITINKINKLNEFEYEEKEEYEITPLPNYYFNSKIHTLSSNKKITTIDGCKTISIFENPYIFIQLLIGKLKRTINIYK